MPAQKRPYRSLPIILVILHSLLVLTLAALIGLSDSGESAMLWGMMLVIDFPMSVIYFLGDLTLISALKCLGVTRETQLDIHLYWTPSVMFFLLGGIQYFFIGKLIAYLLSLKEARRRRTAENTSAPSTMG